MPMFRKSDEFCGGGGPDTCRLLEGPGGGDGVGVEVNVGYSPGYCVGDNEGVTYKGRLDRLWEWDDDVLGKDTSQAMLRDLRPALVISAHLHRPCALLHNRTRSALNSDASDCAVVAEVTLPTFAWRMRPDAGYAVAQVNFEESKNGLWDIYIYVYICIYIYMYINICMCVCVCVCVCVCIYICIYIYIHIYINIFRSFSKSRNNRLCCRCVRCRMSTRYWACTWLP